MIRGRYYTDHPVEDPGRSRREGLIAAEVLLVLAMVAAPLLLGAVRLWSLALVAGVVFAAAVAAALGRERRVSWPALLALALAGWTALTVVPLPRALLSLLSPRGLELLELSLGPITSHSLSLDPAGSAREVGRLLLLALGAATASRLAAEGAPGRRLAHTVAALTVLQCLFIIGHKVVATTSVYGVFTPKQYSHVLGTFSNANLLAAYLGLGVPVMLALAAVARERGDALAWLSAAALAMVMVLLTGSRSGIGGLTVALLVLAIAWRRRLGEHRTVVLALGGVLVLGAAAAAFLDAGRAAKLASLVQPDRIASDLKVRAWRDIPQLVRDYWAAGIGRGAFETVFPAYKRVPEVLTFTHAECAPLQILADYGVLVGTAVMAAWILALVRSMRPAPTGTRPEEEGQRMVRQGALAALAGFTVHELGDFALDVSAAVDVQVAVLFGLLWPARRLSDPGPTRRWEPPGWVLAAWRRLEVRAAATGLCMALGAAGLTYGARGEIARDVAAVTAASVPGADLEAMLREAIARHPGEPWFQFMAGLDRVRHRQPRAALRYLNRALILDPTSWRPHLAIAEALFQMGRTDQGVLEMRLAYLGSAFDDQVAVATLAHREFTGPDAARFIAHFGGGNPAVLAAYAGYLDRAGRDDATALVAGLLLDLRPDDLGAHRLMARADVRRKRFATALEHARRLPAGDSEALLLQVQSLDGLGRGSESDALLEGIERSAHEGPGSVLAPGTVMLLAERALSHGNAAAALAALERVKEDALVPEELGRLHLLRATALDKLGRLNEAIAESKAAARIYPCEQTWMAQGELYERAGLLREALLVYRGAMRSLPSPSEALRTHRARIELMLGAPTINGGAIDQRSPTEARTDSEGRGPAGDDDQPSLTGEGTGEAGGDDTEGGGAAPTWRHRAVDTEEEPEGEGEEGEARRERRR